MPAAYSATPLAQKLGLRDGQRVLFLGLPEELAELAAARDFGQVRRSGWDGLDGDDYDYVHGFTASRAVLDGKASALRQAIRPAGVVWVSWPKRASKVPTDVTEDVIREVLLPTGLVDVKVAAVDNVWSGLKMMIRKELR